ncbi:hypothetical protein STEG23_016022, partial [Scotinomys teguina]
MKPLSLHLLACDMANEAKLLRQVRNKVRFEHFSQCQKTSKRTPHISCFNPPSPQIT